MFVGSQGWGVSAVVYCVCHGTLWGLQVTQQLLAERARLRTASTSFVAVSHVVSAVTTPRHATPRYAWRLPQFFFLLVSVKCCLTLLEMLWSELWHHIYDDHGRCLPAMTVHYPGVISGWSRWYQWIIQVISVDYPGDVSRLSRWCQ